MRAIRAWHRSSVTLCSVTDDLAIVLQCADDVAKLGGTQPGVEGVDAALEY